jgi:hypothetical protein
MGNYHPKINMFITTQSVVSVAVFLNLTHIYGRTALTLETSLTVETCTLSSTADVNTYEISRF